MVRHIEDIAIDKSKEYKRNYIKSRIKYFFRKLFPFYYSWKLNKDIEKYERQEL